VFTNIQKKKKKKKKDYGILPRGFSFPITNTKNFPPKCQSFSIALNSSSNQHRLSNPQSFPSQKLKKLLPHSLKPCLNLFSNFSSGSTNAFLSDTAEKLKKLKKKRENSNPSTIQAIKFSKKFKVFLPGNVVMFGILKQSKQDIFF
jgi:hypothetical protein